MLNFYTPENTRKTGMFSDVFKVYRNVTLGKNGLWQANYVKNNFLIQPVAPDDIIGVLRCHWKETKKGCCTSPKCSWRSNSLNHAYQRVDTVVGMAVITAAYVIMVTKVMMTMSKTIFLRYCWDIDSLHGILFMGTLCCILLLEYYVTEAYSDQSNI